MGITIHYKIHFISDGNPYDKVRKMYDIAKEFERRDIFDKIHPIKIVTPSDVERLQKLTFENSTYEERADLNELERMVWIEREDGRTVGIRTKPKEGSYFYIAVGGGAEWADIGLSKTPRYAEYDNKKYPTKFQEWTFSGFCKTQYAHNYGPEHFLRCHIGLCEYLKAIQKIDGIAVEVTDEADYYETQDPEKAVNAVSELGMMIAAIGVMIGDSLSGTEATYTSPIQEHPRIEELETKGLEMFKEFTGLEQIADAINYKRNAFFNMKINNLEDADQWFGLFENKLSDENYKKISEIRKEVDSNEARTKEFIKNIENIRKEMTK